MIKNNNKDVDVAILEIQYENLKELIEKGFAGVHIRQDIANGKLLKHEGNLIKVEEQLNNVVTKSDCNLTHTKVVNSMENIKLDNKDEKVEEYRKFKWFIFGIIGTIVGAIIINLLFKYVFV